MSTDKFANGSVNTIKLADRAATTIKLADNAVTNAKILNTQLLIPNWLLQLTLIPMEPLLYVVLLVPTYHVHS